MSTATWLWIGGTSGLARTYFNTFPVEHNRWIVLGRKKAAPTWLKASSYLSLDFAGLATSNDEVMQNILSNLPPITRVVVSIRPPLLCRLSHAAARRHNARMADGLELFLQQLLQMNRSMLVIHVSSIAAVDHLKGQNNQGLDTPEPSSNELMQPYDYFKRRCEEIVLRLESDKILGDARDGRPTASDLCVTNVRLGAIFSDGPNCIQCRAMALQAYVGAYLPYPIDSNSSRNVAMLLRLMCQLCEPSSDSVRRLRPVYYYTRPLRYASKPIPYGDYLMDYREGEGICYYLWIPLLMVQLIQNLVLWLTRTFSAFFVQIPYLESMNYLLQVSSGPHSFSNSSALEDFPELVYQEETILECFRRRRLA